MWLGEGGREKRIRRGESMEKRSRLHGEVWLVVQGNDGLFTRRKRRTRTVESWILCGFLRRCHGLVFVTDEVDEYSDSERSLRRDKLCE